MKRIITIIFILGIIGGGAVYYYTFHMPHKNTFDLKADYSIAAPQLFAKFESDEMSANKEYLGKILEVEGKIVDVKEFNGNFEVSLEDEMEGITCLIDSSYAVQQKEEILKLKPGQKVKIKGQCNGYMMGVKMDRCVLVLNKK